MPNSISWWIACTNIFRLNGDSMIRYLDLKAQYLSIQSEIDEAIRAVLADSSFVRGPHVQTFETNFATYCGAAHAIAVANGTDALEIALKSLNLTRGAEVIVPAYTFIACAEAVIANGLVPVFCDVDPQTFCMTSESVKAVLSNKTAALMPVHLYGQPCDMDDLLTLARQHQLKVIEDCSQAHGARYKGQRVGVFGDVATFSFYPGKNLGAYGDAGMILTASQEVADYCRRHADHGRQSKYTHEFVGRNSRMDGLQGAILNVKLKHLDAWTARRQQVAALYDAGLCHVKQVEIPWIGKECESVYHLYVIRARERDRLQEHLKSRGIETGVHYPLSLNQQPALTAWRQSVSLPVSDSSGTSVLSLPMGEHLTEADVECVIAAVREFYS